MNDFKRIFDESSFRKSGFVNIRGDSGFCERFIVKKGIAVSFTKYHGEVNVCCVYQSGRYTYKYSICDFLVFEMGKEGITWDDYFGKINIQCEFAKYLLAADKFGGEILGNPHMYIKRHCEEPDLVSTFTLDVLNQYFNK